MTTLFLRLGYFVILYGLLAFSHATEATPTITTPERPDIAATETMPRR